MADPYLQPDGLTLVNKLGITDDPQLLAEMEAIHVASRELEIRGLGYPDKHGVDLLKAIHRHLYQDVYEWAGEFRQVNLSKQAFAQSADATIFSPASRLNLELQKFFQRLTAQDNLRDLPPALFVDRLAPHFVTLNHIHPFREGNGRTQTLFWRKIAQDAGHELSFSVISRERMIAVSIAGELGNTASVKHMLSDVIHPIRSAALQRAITFLENARKKGSPVDWQERFIATTAPGQAYEGQMIGKSGQEFLFASSDGLYVGWVGDLPQHGRDLAPGSFITFEASWSSPDIDIQPDYGRSATVDQRHDRLSAPMQQSSRSGPTPEPD
ncbi:Fic family protein [Acetobacter orientalis]|uniref:Fic/DOC family protein n=1 Tax=Acetobacter orientalis TaxID=146474 RepID=UPI0020A1FF81|nr:Fic family protein [Acetobacter orientalis]MCP1220086.1 Fic family protein [Acetobacter orientalis]